MSYKNFSEKDIDGEIWEFIPNYNGRYQVSNFGRVKSLYANGKVKIMKQYISVGYLKIDLYNNWVIKKSFVHRLVAKLFIPNPENKRVVNHKNGITTDNRVTELEWCTDSENSIHSFYYLGRKPSKGPTGMTGELSPLSKRVIQMDKNLNVIRIHGSVGDAAKYLNVWKSRIGKCCKDNDLKYSAYGFKWKYA
jgi:hypothetical protein